MTWVPPRPNVGFEPTPQHKVNLKFPCPCCGRLIFKKPPGSKIACEICYWIDDASQLRWPTLANGMNFVTLMTAQRNYGLHGACESHFAKNVRQPAPNEYLDNGFRPIDPAIDFFEDPVATARSPWPQDPTFLFYWRPTFWLRPQTQNAPQYRQPPPGYVPPPPPGYAPPPGQYLPPPGYVPPPPPGYVPPPPPGYVPPPPQNPYPQNPYPQPPPPGYVPPPPNYPPTQR